MNRRRTAHRGRRLGRRRHATTAVYAHLDDVWGRQTQDKIRHSGRALRSSLTTRLETRVSCTLSDSSAVRLANGPRSDTAVLSNQAIPLCPRDQPPVKRFKPPEVSQRPEIRYLCARKSSDLSLLRLANGPRSDTCVPVKSSDLSLAEVSQRPEIRYLCVRQIKRFKRSRG